MLNLIPIVTILAALPGGLGISAGSSISSFGPTEEQYDSRFMTPGVSYGLSATLDAPGPLAFHLGGEYFHKTATSGWDGEIESFLFWASPCGQLPLMEGFRVFGGPALVGVTGDYSGTDDFGSFVEESGTSVGFGASAGADIVLWGPVSARLEYRRAWMDLLSDRVEKDGQETIVYPAAETDLGYSQYMFTLNFEILPVDE